MKAFLLSLILLTTLTSQGQTVEEWFRQKQTKKDYLVQQIAALQAYAGTLRQGYEVASQGISAVQHIKNGDLVLHQVFFGSLKNINPAVSNSARVADILSLQLAIIRGFAGTAKALQQENLLQAAELAYIGQVKETVLQACYQDLETLWLVLSTGELEISDEERLRQLEAQYSDMLDKYHFTVSFTREAKLLALQRAKLKREAETGKAIFCLP